LEGIFEGQRRGRKGIIQTASKSSEGKPEPQKWVGRSSAIFCDNDFMEMPNMTEVKKLRAKQKRKGNW
jgi:hypothetical protein